MRKICFKCNTEKDLDEFVYNATQGKYTNECKSCKAIYKKKYYNKPENAAKQKAYNQTYYIENENEIRIRNIQYYSEHREEKIEYQKEYAAIPKNKSKRNRRDSERKKNDPVFRLRWLVSNSILAFLFNNWDLTKEGQSCIQYLNNIVDGSNYIELLKSHIEKQFEGWMTWDNHGVYDPKAWDDNNPSTWKWQLDHIIPHSLFKYANMDCDEFRQCWALENLRPLSAKQNILDGARKTGYQK